MYWILSVIYGIVSGLTSFLPLSSSAHQSLVLYMFGWEQRQPIWDMMIHIALLLALFVGCRPLMDQLRRDIKIAEYSRTNRIRRAELRGLHILRLVRTASLPMCIGLFFSLMTGGIEKNLLFLVLFLLVNGVILFLPERVSQGNKQASLMTKTDAYLIGVCGAFAAIPGISMIGAATTASIFRGAEKQQALNWSLLLCVPMLIVLIIIDFISIFTIGISGFTFGMFVAGILGALFAFGFGYLSIVLLRLLMTKVGLSGFAYYSWGVCLLTFVLYLKV